MQPIRIGVVGVGKIARDHHLPSLRANPAFTVIAAASRHATVEGVANYHSIEELLEGSPDVDAVALCTPPQAHYHAARLALSHGKHVLMEKPPCTSIAQLQELQKVAERHGRTLYQTWHSQYARAVPDAIRILEGRRLLRAEITWKENAQKWHRGQEWLWEPGGFGVLDCGINALSIMTRLIPDAIYPSRASLLIPANRSTPIAAEIELVTDTGVPISAVFDYRHTGPEVWNIEFQTDRGPLLLYAGGNCLTETDEAVQPVPVTLAHEYEVIYRRFAELVARGESEVDARPLVLVADILMIAKLISVPAFALT